LRCWIRSQEFSLERESTSENFKICWYFFYSLEEHLTNAGIGWLTLVQGFDSIMVKIEGVSAEFMRGSAREEKNPGIRYRTIYLNIGADL
jgi:hypothetical protein